MKQFTNVLIDPHFINQTADVVIIGGGPAAFGIVAGLKEKNKNLSIILLEQNNRFEGSAYASLRHFRTYQTHKDLSLAVAQTIEWYEKLPKKTEKSLERFPYIFIARTPDQLQVFQQNLSVTQSLGFGKDAKILTPKEVTKQFSFINSEKNVAGGLLYPDAGMFNLSQGCGHIIETSTNSLFCLNTKAEKIVVENGKVTGVTTGRGFISSPIVIAAPGGFVLETLQNIQGTTLKELKTLKKNLKIKKRQSFEAKLQNFPANTKMFLIAQEGAYVRISTNEHGEGIGKYGFADATAPEVDSLEVNPMFDGKSFSQKVFAQFKTLTHIPLDTATTNGLAGYYVEAADHLPIISSTSVPGLYMCAVLDHFGVMTHIGLGKQMADIVLENTKAENPFRINRTFTHEQGSVL